ncbi:MAG: UPF0175 family protein [Thermomicrobiales bacterium]
MATKTVTIELPESIIQLLGTTESASKETHRAIVIELFRRGEISQGKAAELLGISKRDMLPIMEEYGIYHGPQTEEEVDEELETVRRLGRSK